MQMAHKMYDEMPQLIYRTYYKICHVGPLLRCVSLLLSTFRYLGFLCVMPLEAFIFKLHLLDSCIPASDPFVLFLPFIVWGWLTSLSYYQISCLDDISYNHHLYLIISNIPCLPRLVPNILISLLDSCRSSFLIIHVCGLNKIMRFTKQ